MAHLIDNPWIGSKGWIQTKRSSDFFPKVCFVFMASTDTIRILLNDRNFSVLTHPNTMIPTCTQVVDVWNLNIGIIRLSYKTICSFLKFFYEKKKKKSSHSWKKPPLIILFFFSPPNFKDGTQPNVVTSVGGNVLYIHLVLSNHTDGRRFSSLPVFKLNQWFIFYLSSRGTKFLLGIYLFLFPVMKLQTLLC